MENRIKVLIADGSEAFCGHLKNELQQLDGYDLVGTAADGEEAVRLLEATKPDILVPLGEPVILVNLRTQGRLLAHFLEVCRRWGRGAVK